ncbi:MAG: HEAT repeat domain-containing protein, partial [Rhodothermales bacterium]
IYRVTPKGKSLRTPKLDLSTTEGQIEALKSPAVNVRALGFARLKAQGPAVLDAVKALLDAPNPYHRARAIWLLAGLGEPGMAEVQALLESPDPDVRLTAFRALRSVGADVLTAAQILAQDSSAAVRREVAVALRNVPLEASQDLILELARRYDGKDRYYLEALGLAADGKEETLYPLLRAELGGEPTAWDDRFAGIAWRLHPLAALEDLQARAAASGVPEAARKQALTAIGFIQDVRAANAMASLAQSDLPDVAEQAAWWLRYRTTNDWRGYEIDGWSGATSEMVTENQTEMARLREIVTDTTSWMDVRMEAAFEMAQDPLGGSLLLGLMATDQLPYQVRSGVRSALLTNPNPTQRQMASALFSGSDTELDSADWSTSALAQRDADPAEGEMLFWANCASCHRLGEIGNDVGPELTGIRGKFDQAGLIDAIVRPSAAIAHGYEPQLVTTEEGRAVYGFLVADGPTLVFKDQTGQQQTIEKNTVATQTTFEASLMPDPATLRLTPQSVADIAAFLMAGE